MPSSTQAAPKINVKTLASDAGVAVEAYDTYDSDEETLAAAHRFAAALVERVALICEAQPTKTLDAATLRRIASSLAPR
ncbi:MAG: hypothetical protein AB9M60_00765 [Leptothrix sp. (in: b-proteobacteria)]